MLALRGQRRGGFSGTAGLADFGQERFYAGPHGRVIKLGYRVAGEAGERSGRQRSDDGSS